MIRKILGLLGVEYLSRDEVMKIAERECETNSWVWEPPVSVRDGLWETTVMVWGERRGGTACIRIDARTGEVLSVSVTPR